MRGSLAAWFGAPRSSRPTKLSSAKGAASQPRPHQAFPWGKVAFAKQMTDEGRSVKKMCRWHIFSVGPASYAGRVSPDRTGETLSKPISFSLLEKEWFLESKEKGAPVRVEWLQIVIRRPGFTPPLSTGTVHSGLRRRNRGRPWSYPTFFRRLRRWASERGGTAWYCPYRGARRRRGKVHSIRNARMGIPPFISLPLLSPEKRCALSWGP